MSNPLRLHHRCVLSLPFLPHFINLARKHSARRIIPRHPSTTSIVHDVTTPHDHAMFDSLLALTPGGLVPLSAGVSVHYSMV